jgi:hypothetical protein
VLGVTSLLHSPNKKTQAARPGSSIQAGVTAISTSRPPAS